MPHRYLVMFTLLGMLTHARGADAQLLGTFSWQLQPYCNRVVLTAVQQVEVIALTGYDDRCGSGPRAPVTGVAVPNPDGTIAVGLTIVPAAQATLLSYLTDARPISATVNLATLNGTWQDAQQQQGTFAFAAATGGSRRPQHNYALSAIDFEDNPSIVGYSASGSSNAMAAVADARALVGVYGGGFDGAGLGLGGGLVVRSTETWTPAAHGAELSFVTTATGGTALATRLRIGADGRVAIGNHAPQDALDVNGDIRLGTSGSNGCVRNKSGGAITGICSSDVRFKQDATPFALALDAVARLRPVHYHWRAAAFPERGFGQEPSYGLIAQEVAAVMPELVSTDSEGYEAVDYGKLPLLAIQAIKELKEKHDALERRLRILEVKQEQR